MKGLMSALGGSYYSCSLATYTSASSFVAFISSRFLTLSCLFINLYSAFFCSKLGTRGLGLVVMARTIPWAKTCSSFSLELFFLFSLSFRSFELLSLI